MPSSQYWRAGARRSSWVSYAAVLVVGVVFGLLAEEIGGLVARYPVESVLLAVMGAGVVTLAWSGWQLLHGAARRVEAIMDEELGRPGGSAGVEGKPERAATDSAMRNW